MADNADTPLQERMRRKMYAVARELTLSRDERIELSRLVLRREIMSWKELDPQQINRMLDALEGATALLEIARQRQGSTLPLEVG